MLNHWEIKHTKMLPLSHPKRKISNNSRQISSQWPNFEFSHSRLCIYYSTINLSIRLSSIHLSHGLFMWIRTQVTTMLCDQLVCLLICRLHQHLLLFSLSFYLLNKPDYLFCRVLDSGFGWLYCYSDFMCLSVICMPYTLVSALDTWSDWELIHLLKISL